jgi:hypothetical protein
MRTGVQCGGRGVFVTVTTARKRLVTASLLAAVLFIVAQSVAHLIATAGLHVCDATGFAECPSVFDLDHNNGIADAVSTAVIATAALGAAVLGVRRRPRQVAAMALATILFLVTIEDALHLGENARTKSGTIVVGTVLCAAVLTILVAVGESREIRWLLLVGTALLAIDAKAPYLYDQIMNAVGQPALARGDLLYELGIVLDEAMELAGWTLLAVGLWDAARAVRVSEGDPRTSRGAVQLLRE